MCREHGRQLTEFAAEHPDLMSLIGVVKETSDPEGLPEFYEKYFNFPLYQDEGFGLYKSFGSRKITENLSWNPFKLWNGFQELKGRIAEKGIKGNYVGEGFIQGGVMVFNNKGKLYYAQEENIGTEFNLSEIALAMKGETSSSSTAENSSSNVGEAKEEL